MHTENTRTESTRTDRTLLPRGLVPRRRPTAGSFRIGETVQFHDLVAIIMTRDATASGEEFHDVHVLNDTSGRPIRTVRAAYLTSLPRSAHA